MKRTVKRITLAEWDRMAVAEKWRSWRAGERIRREDMPELKRRHADVRPIRAALQLSELP